MKIIQQHITKNKAYINNVNKADSRYTTFQQNGPKGAVLHSVGAAQPSAKVFANYFNNPNLEASVHAVLQPDGTVYQLAPWNYRMWHVGGSANNTHIGIEMTEPDCIWYDTQNGYKLHIKDQAKALAFVKQTYAVAVELFAILCQKYHWNPLADGVIISHSEAHKRGWGSAHADPEHLWNAVGSGYTMHTFRNDVAKKLKEEPELTEAQVKQIAQEAAKATATTVAKTTAQDTAKTVAQTIAQATAQGVAKSTAQTVAKSTAQSTVQALMAAKNTGDAPNKWAEEATEWAKATGLIAGYADKDGKPTGDYAWQKPMTRQEMVALLYRFSKLMQQEVEEQETAQP